MSTNVSNHGLPKGKPERAEKQDSTTAIRATICYQKWWKQKSCKPTSRAYTFQPKPWLKARSEWFFEGAPPSTDATSTASMPQKTWPNVHGMPIWEWPPHKIACTQPPPHTYTHRQNIRIHEKYWFQKSKCNRGSTTILQKMEPDPMQNVIPMALLQDIHTKNWNHWKQRPFWEKGFLLSYFVGTNKESPLLKKDVWKRVVPTR